jgi:hypothetical protein
LDIQQKRRVIYFSNVFVGTLAGLAFVFFREKPELTAQIFQKYPIAFIAPLLLVACILFLTMWVAFAVTRLIQRIVWRCPQCSRYLGHSFWPKFCMNCGTRLEAL